jgi:hypothetical protein
MPHSLLLGLLLFAISFYFLAQVLLFLYRPLRRFRTQLLVTSDLFLFLFLGFYLLPYFHLWPF